MRKAYSKDCKRMFKNNLFRFISIVLIIMLGTAFFIGMNSVSPEMKETAEKYIENQNVFDISLVSNLGYKDEDIEKIKENEHVESVQAAYTYDALAKYDDKDIAVRLTASMKEITMNKNDIEEGRDIEENNECLIDSRLQTMNGYNVGDTIKVYRKDSENIDDYVSETEFKIVGITRNPVYLSKFYGNTSLLTGELNGYLMIKEEVFKSEYYTAVYIKTDIDNNLDKFSDEYKDNLDEISEDIISINDNIVNEKYQKIHNENLEKITTAEDKINKVEEYIESLNKQIQDSQKKINSGMTNISAIVSSQYSVSAIYERISQKNDTINSKYADLNNAKSDKNQIENDYHELKIEVTSLNKELEELSNSIDKNLYELYSLNEEESKYVELNKDVNKLYYEYNKKNDEYEKINNQYIKKAKELEEKKNTIEALNKEIKNSQNDLYNSFSGLEDLIYAINIPQLIENLEQVKQSKETIEENKQNLEEQKLDEKIQDAKDELNQNKQELSEFKTITETTKLYENSGFKALKNDLDKIAIMGRIFPVMFFVVAALVTITTITRMIEEERKNLGTLKALGYSKKTIISRYIIYSFSATLLGLILGVAIGSTLIVQILFVAYSSLYDLPELLGGINVFYTMLVTVISLITTVLVTLIITIKELKENAAELMRPKAVKEGKNILLERIPFIWKRLGFLFKICFRNIFRYKRRLLMTLVGIAGCTALIYAGLGLQSSINEIGEKQFNDLKKLSLEVYLQDETSSEEIKDIQKYVEEQNKIEKVTPVSQKSFTIEANDNSKDAFYVAIDGDKVEDYITLRDRKTQEKINLNDDGVVLTEKLANILEVKVGDKVKIKTDETDTSVKVIGITENYLYNFVYLTPNMYERIYEKEIQYNELFANTNSELNNDEELSLADDLKQNEKITSVILEKQYNQEFQKSLASLMSIVILFIGCASLLSFVVLVNLNNINIEERKRELATLKVLGFYKKELESYVFRENIILTILGTIFGLGLGMAILGVIIQSAEVETIFLSKDINLINLIISTIITLLFTLVTNLLMKKKIKNIDMIDSLKSIE